MEPSLSGDGGVGRVWKWMRVRRENTRGGRGGGIRWRKRQRRIRVGQIPLTGSGMVDTRRHWK